MSIMCVLFGHVWERIIGSQAWVCSRCLFKEYPHG